MAEEGVRVTSVSFRRYKSLRDFDLSLEHMNVLVGPNNSGKSTVIGAFRILSVALGKARSRRPERLRVIEGWRPGYSIPTDAIPVSLENVHTDYADEWSSVTFRLSSGGRLILEFPPEGGCYLVPDPEGPTITGPSQFRQMYPLEFGVVPVLGSLEHDETLVLEETVRRGLVTHLASRHFRNYWYHYPSEFDQFRELLMTTWPDVDIKRPELAGPGANQVIMFCEEKRISRELFWAGFGFQIWCQILSHLVRMQAVSSVLIDEPEIYLHPDLQRRLVGLLRDLGPDILIATHSSEVIAEVEPSDIVVVDKTRRSGQRVRSTSGVQDALSAIGSSQNVVLAQLTRTRRVLFVEGNDHKVLRRFAARLGMHETSNGIGVTSIPLGGFPDPPAVKALARGIEMAVGERVAFAGVFDRDYRSEHEVELVEGQLDETLSYRHIYTRKEIENFLLIPNVLQRAVERALLDRSIRQGKSTLPAPTIRTMLLQVTEEFRVETHAQLLTSVSRGPKTGRDDATRTKEFIAAFESKWADLDRRLAIVPGKRVLSQLNVLLQRDYSVALSHARIIAAFHVTEVPFELVTVLRELDAFRLRDPDETSSQIR